MFRRSTLRQAVPPVRTCYPSLRISHTWFFGLKRQLFSHNPRILRSLPYSSSFLPTVTTNHSLITHRLPVSASVYHLSPYQNLVVVVVVVTLSLLDRVGSTIERITILRTVPEERKDSIRRIFSFYCVIYISDTIVVVAFSLWNLSSQKTGGSSRIPYVRQQREGEKSGGVPFFKYLYLIPTKKKKKKKKKKNSRKEISNIIAFERDSTTVFQQEEDTDRLTHTTVVVTNQSETNQLTAAATTPTTIATRSVRSNSKKKVRKKNISYLFYLCVQYCILLCVCLLTGDVCIVWL